MNWLWVWLAIIIISVILETLTVGLTSIWMTGGALAAMVVTAFGGSVLLQTVIFFFVTAVLLIFTRPLAVKFINQKRIKTNAEAMTGREVRVIERVDNRKETGKVIANGMEWTARAQNSDDIFELDEMAEVAEISGVKLILKKQI